MGVVQNMWLMVIFLLILSVVFSPVVSGWRDGSVVCCFLTAFKGKFKERRGKRSVLEPDYGRRDSCMPVHARYTTIDLGQ